MAAERAISRERTSHEERAINVESAKKAERARSCESAILSERAIAVESAINDESSLLGTTSGWLRGGFDKRRGRCGEQRPLKESTK
jgi:hypothetical protein